LLMVWISSVVRGSFFHIPFILAERCYNYIAQYRRKPAILVAGGVVVIATE